MITLSRKHFYLFYFTIVLQKRHWKLNNNTIVLQKRTNFCFIFSEAPDQYLYKAYLETLLSYNRDVKDSWLNSNGYHEDFPMMGHSTLTPNVGYQARTRYFRKDYDVKGEFSEEGAHLIGR